MAGIRITQLHPQQSTGKRYGSCTDKGSIHPVGRLTQLHPQHATGRRYGTFAGRAAVSLHPVGRLTQCRPQMATGRRYGSFAGRTAAVVVPVVILPAANVGGGGTGASYSDGERHSKLAHRRRAEDMELMLLIQVALVVMEEN